MLSSLQLPSQIGIGVPKMNVGKLKTWGWDFNISWKDKIKDINYQVSFNISDSQNKLVQYDGASTIKAGTVDLLEGYEMNTGQAVKSIYNIKKTTLAINHSMMVRLQAVMSNM